MKKNIAGVAFILSCMFPHISAYANCEDDLLDASEIVAQQSPTIYYGRPYRQKLSGRGGDLEFQEFAKTVRNTDFRVSSSWNVTDVKRMDVALADDRFYNEGQVYEVNIWCGGVNTNTCVEQHKTQLASASDEDRQAGLLSIPVRGRDNAQRLRASLAAIAQHCAQK